MKAFTSQIWNSPWFRLSLVQLFITPAIVMVGFSLLHWLSLPAEWRIYHGPNWGQRWTDGMVVACYLMPAIWLAGWVAAAFRRNGIPREMPRA